jgi:hypothetical protein
MQTVPLLVITMIGGLVALFFSAGWASYKEKKLPETPVLFRWFVTGLLTSGLGAYAWLFGAGGDPSALLESVGEALEVKEVVKTLTSAVNSGAAEAVQAAGDAVSAMELNVGMPSF